MYIEKLTNENIARLLLRQLWQVYSAGGISHGRSLEGRLLEAAMNIIPLPRNIDPDFFWTECLLKEGRIRLKEKPRIIFQRLCTPEQPNFFSSKLIASLLLGKIQELYAEDDQREIVNWQYSQTEKELLQVAYYVFLLDLSENISELVQSFSIKEIIKVSDDRCWNRNKVNRRTP